MGRDIALEGVEQDGFRIVAGCGWSWAVSRLVRLHFTQPRRGLYSPLLDTTVSLIGGDRVGSGGEGWKGGGWVPGGVDVNKIKGKKKSNPRVIRGKSASYCSYHVVRLLYFV